MKKISMPKFVVQEHHAKKAGLHYDFRLEHEGVLKSWACRKPPPTVVGRRVLAVETEDHPLWYLTFEGEIESSYGKGTVKIWDTGEYEMVSEESDKLVFILYGEKLKGYYALVKMDADNWLLMKVDTL
jgi:DNA ligase D-like protein (predicted 3'-phosphoesterase)